MSPMRRGPDGRSQLGSTWESLIERQIREAQEAGAFDDLPHQGERLPVDDDTSEWAMAHKILREAGAAPPWIEADKEARARRAAIDELLDGAARAPRPVSDGTRRRLRATLADHVEAANRAIELVNAEAPTTRQHRRPMDAADLAERLERALTG